jgi:hypothetical protein
LVHEESWGLKKLAYPIQKKSSGFLSCSHLWFQSMWIGLSKKIFVKDSLFKRKLSLTTAIPIQFELQDLRYHFFKQSRPLSRPSPDPHQRNKNERCTVIEPISIFLI